MALLSCSLDCIEQSLKSVCGSASLVPLVALHQNGHARKLTDAACARSIPAAEIRLERELGWAVLWSVCHPVRNCISACWVRSRVPTARLRQRHSASPSLHEIQCIAWSWQGVLLIQSQAADEPNSKMMLLARWQRFMALMQACLSFLRKVATR